MGCSRLPEQPLARQVGEVGHDGQRRLGSKGRSAHDLAACVQLCTTERLRRLRRPPRLLRGRRERQHHWSRSRSRVAVESKADRQDGASLSRREMFGGYCMVGGFSPRKRNSLRKCPPAVALAATKLEHAWAYRGTAIACALLVAGRLPVRSLRGRVRLLWILLEQNRAYRVPR